jgi:DNA-directed RNA polymerase II subunit RPB4
VHRSIQQFVDYLDMFARYKQTENLHSMGGIFDSNPQINPVERAMLGMLPCRLVERLS